MRIVFFTDLHLGNNKVPADAVYAHLVEYLYPQLTPETDILVFGGDFFDILLNMDSAAAMFVHLIRSDLQRLAKECGFYIRAVRGTFTHDRNQLPHVFVEPDHNEPAMLHGQSHFNWFEKMAIETIDSLGISLLYIPDDLGFANMMDVAKELLEQHQLDKVDIVVHHGYLSHLIPIGLRHEPPNTYTSEEYLEICKGPVLNGHIHHPGIYKQVINGGSFERSRHGEEEAKGFFTVEYDLETNRTHAKFIENKGAYIFKTLDLTKLDAEASVALFRKTVDDHVSENSNEKPLYVRIIVDEIGVREAVRAGARGYPNWLKLDTKRSNATDQASLDDIMLSHADLPRLTPDNLVEHTHIHLTNRGVTITPETIREVLSMITK